MTRVPRRRFAALVSSGLAGLGLGAGSGAGPGNGPCDGPGRGCGFASTVPVPFGMYSMPPARMGELARAGFVWAGPFYPRELEELPERVAAAAAAGLGVVYPVGPHHHGSLGRGPFPYELASTQRRVATTVARLADDPTVAAWYVLPEELRPHEAKDRAYLRAIARTVAAHDPQRRPLAHYQPNGRTAAGLGQICEALDWVTKGTYTNYAGHRDQRAWVRHSTAQIVKASTAGQRPLTTLEMFEQPAAGSPVERWVRHDIFAALVSGARGIWVFSGWQRPRFPAYERYFRAYRDVARLLNGPLGIGRSLMEAGPTFTPTVVAGPPTTAVRLRHTTLNVPSVAAVTSDSGGAQTLVLVNSANAAVQLHVPTMTGAAAVMDTADWRSGPAELKLPPLGVAVLRR